MSRLRTGIFSGFVFGLKKKKIQMSKLRIFWPITLRMQNQICILQIQNCSFRLANPSRLWTILTSLQNHYYLHPMDNKPGVLRKTKSVNRTGYVFLKRCWLTFSSQTALLLNALLHVDCLTPPFSRWLSSFRFELLVILYSFCASNTSNNKKYKLKAA